jgi:hypothetical protein
MSTSLKRGQIVTAPPSSVFNKTYFKITKVHPEGYNSIVVTSDIYKEGRRCFLNKDWGFILVSKEEMDQLKATNL